MSRVFVIDAERRPQDPVHPGTARWLLDHRQAAVFRRFPFTLILKRAIPNAQPEHLRVKVDPGSKTTGLALLNDTTGQVMWAGELAHRGQQVSDALRDRRIHRSLRRARHTRYRAARFDNRRRRDGWLPPSLESRISNVLTWVARLRRYAAIGTVAQELVRFDTQLLENPAIGGVEYQQGELAGYEVRQYLLEKCQRACAYCGAQQVPLQVEHIVPKARGGSNRVSNLTIACARCNSAKGTQTAAEFGYPDVDVQAKLPLRDAAAVNASRWALLHRFEAIGLPVEVGTGGRTKWNRTKRGLPKAHWIDAARVGASTPERIHIEGFRPLGITATGHGTRQMRGTDQHGFPTRHRTRQKRHFGFQTGDMVRAAVPPGRKTSGWHIGRVQVRASGSFDLTTAARRVQGVSHRYCWAISRSDGYGYTS